MILKLFSEETKEMIKNVPKSEAEKEKNITEKYLKEQKKFAEEGKEKKKTRILRKPKERTIADLGWEISHCKDKLKELEAQDETGWDDFQISIQGKEVNSKLVRNHIIYYTQERNKLREPLMPMLDKWKDFVTNLIKERGEEIDVIWFDISQPMDCEMCVRLKGHKCWHSCVDFRFEKGQLRAFDSQFGNGTSFVNGFGSLNNWTDERTGQEIKEIMERVFNKECSNSSWNRNEDGTFRKIEVDEMGWKIDNGE